MDDFDNLTDEEIQQIIAMGGLDDQNALLSGQLERANALRDQALQSPQMRGNNRVQTAANPLEFLASGVTAYKQGKKADAIQQQQLDLLNRQASGRDAFYQRYFDTPGRRAAKPFIQQMGDIDIPMPEGNF
jgi:hypothetical protein